MIIYAIPQLIILRFVYQIAENVWCSKMMENVHCMDKSDCPNNYYCDLVLGQCDSCDHMCRISYSHCKEVCRNTDTEDTTTQTAYPLIDIPQSGANSKSSYVHPQILILTVIIVILTILIMVICLIYALKKSKKKYDFMYECNEKMENIYAEVLCQTEPTLGKKPIENILHAQNETSTTNLRESSDFIQKDVKPKLTSKAESRHSVIATVHYPDNATTKSTEQDTELQDMSTRRHPYVPARAYRAISQEESQNTPSLLVPSNTQFEDERHSAQVNRTSSIKKSSRILKSPETELRHTGGRGYSEERKMLLSQKVSENAPNNERTNVSLSQGENTRFQLEMYTSRMDDASHHSSNTSVKVTPSPQMVVGT